MARGPSGGGGKQGGGGGGGGGRNRGGGGGNAGYLRAYGYPSERALRLEAGALAGASVPTLRSTEQPYRQQSQSARDFLQAVQAALSETQGQVGSAYDQATASQQALTDAAQARLSGLGLGADAAGVEAAQGARSDSAAANLLSNAASAKQFAAAQPGVAAGNTQVQLAGLNKQEQAAVQSRADALRSAFFQALQQVQGQALAKAQFNQSSSQFAQNYALQQQQLAQSAAASRASLAASQAGAATSEAHWRADYIGRYGIDPYTGKAVGGASGPTGDVGLAKSLGITVNELYGQRQAIAQNISDAKGGIPYNAATMPGVRPITFNGQQWKVPPAVSGAPREPNQPNSIFYMYQFLRQRYAEPVVLQSLSQAYPAATWRVFTRAMFPQPARPISRRAARAGRGPISGTQ